MKRSRLKKLNNQTLVVHARFKKFSIHKYDGTPTALLLHITRANGGRRYLCDHSWLPAGEFAGCERGDIVKFQITVRKIRGGFYLTEPMGMEVLLEGRNGHRG